MNKILHYQDELNFSEDIIYDCNIILTDNKLEKWLTTLREKNESKKLSPYCMANRSFSENFSFLDGADQQVPVIMGILGANAKTVVKDLKTGISGGENFVPQSGWANADTDESKIVPDEQIATKEPSEEVATTESTDRIHQETAQDRKYKDVLERKHALACPDPLHQSDTKNLQTQVE